MCVAPIAPHVYGFAGGGSGIFKILKSSRIEASNFLPWLISSMAEALFLVALVGYPKDLTFQLNPYPRGLR